MLRGLTEQQRIFLESIRKTKRDIKNDMQIKTHCRAMVIIPEMAGLKIMVYNGRLYLPVEITPEMIGHFLGEFAPTCKRVSHGTPGIGASRSSMYVPLK